MRRYESTKKIYDANHIRKNLTFDKSSPMDMRVSNFFFGSGQRKCSNLVVLALNEFMDKYDLENKDSDYLKLFISHYDLFAKKIEAQPQITVSAPSASGTPLPISEEIDEKKCASAAKGKSMRDLANMFG